ncbi:coiled-coil domain-containing protein 137 isoform X2 [Channa argus]|uniref:coiled-coil domain-containing protein 137 isoform X2 n=1 Tax=Channa argus TaxID=215402 RepID=UPI00352149AD
MGKTKKNKTNESGKQEDRAGRHSSPRDKKLKRDGKPKKAKQEDHLEHIPFRLREIMKSRERMKTRPLKAKKLKQTSCPGDKPEDSQDADIPVPHFKREKGESVKSFLHRMEDEAKHVLFLTENQVDRKPEQDVDKGKSEKKKEHDKVRLQRLQQKKLNRQEAKMEKEMFVDHVPFGEVTMAPPSLSAKPKKAPVRSQAPKQLLLNSLLGHSMASTAKPSMARQRIMEEERERAVEAYRHLKKQQQQQQKARTANLEKLKNFE